MTTSPEDEIRALEDRIGSTGGAMGRGFASLADAHRRAGRLDEAWALLDEGLQRYPRFSTAHLVAARVQRDRGEVEEAAQRYGRLLELDPGNVAGLQEAASLAEEEGRLEDAITHLQRLSSLDPFDTELRGRIRSLKERAYLPDGAIDAESPDDGAAAVAEDSANAAAVAEDSADASAAEAEGDPELYTRTLAELYARQGHPGRALDVYRHLRARDPGDEGLSARIRELEAEVGEGLDELEHEWVPGTGVDGDEAPPFAWGGDGEPAEASANDAGIAEEGSIADYFDTLLSWGREEESP